MNDSKGMWAAIAPGVRRKIATVGTNIMSVTLELEAGASIPLHSHPHEQISCIVRGRIQLTMDGRQTEVSAGETFYVAGGAEHSLVALEPSNIVDTFHPLRLDLLERA